jgi:diacylglycerol kinase family enzyme
VYYYIFDPPQGAKEYERTAQIKEYLAELSIAGEMASPQPGRTPEDLVNIAVAKRYSTIVAVGGMELINRVARAVLPYDVVFGILPSVVHEDITALIGTTDWKVAADQLKRRRWQHVRMGVMNGAVCFLTPATIDVPAGNHALVTTDQFTATVPGPLEVEITPQRSTEELHTGFAVRLENQSKPKKVLGLFGGKNTDHPLTAFPCLTVQIETQGPLHVNVAGESLLETPIQCQTESKGIRLIVGKGIASNQS